MGPKAIIIEKVLKWNHFYRTEGKNFRQVTGGGIGLRATGSASKVTMDEWAEKFEELLKENEIECFLLAKYVDDVVVICWNLELGYEWKSNSKRFKWSEERELQYIREGITRSRVTKRCLFGAASMPGFPAIGRKEPERTERMVLWRNKHRREDREHHCPIQVLQEANVFQAWDTPEISNAPGFWG